MKPLNFFAKNTFILKIAHISICGCRAKKLAIFVRESPRACSTFHNHGMRFRSILNLNSTTKSVN